MLLTPEMIDMMLDSFIETLIMVGIAGVIGGAIGIPLGILLHVTSPQGILSAKVFNRTIGVLVNAVRSTPFIILLVAIQPLTRLIVGTSIGTSAALVPLTIAAAPMISRLVESSLREVDKGLIEAALSMGATSMQIIRKVLLPEALPGIIAGITIALVSLVGASAMAGAIGRGGLGDVARGAGRRRLRPQRLVSLVVILIVFVQAMQSLGDWTVRKVSHR